MADYDAVIEIPSGSRNKYEVDHETGRVFLDRVLFTPFGYPTDYGFFENTLGDDGDPLDVLVLLDYPLFPGVGVKVRPVGVLQHDGRRRRRRQGHRRARQGPALGRTSRTSTTSPSTRARRSSTSSSTTRTSSPASGSRPRAGATRPRPSAHRQGDRGVPRSLTRFHERADAPGHPLVSSAGSPHRRSQLRAARAQDGRAAADGEPQMKYSRTGTPSRGASRMRPPPR